MIRACQPWDHASIIFTLYRFLLPLVQVMMHDLVYAAGVILATHLMGMAAYRSADPIEVTLKVWSSPRYKTVRQSLTGKLTLLAFLGAWPIFYARSVSLCMHDNYSLRIQHINVTKIAGRHIIQVDVVLCNYSLALSCLQWFENHEQPHLTCIRGIL